MNEATVPARLSEQLRESIEERIATGAYPPGTRLDEVDLATEFGVSRTPVREALIQLASCGIVQMRPRRGAVVAEIPAHRLLEMFQVMGELEALCARLAARRGTAEEQRALLAAHNACEAARDGEDPDTYYYLNERFHLMLYALSHNSFLAEEAGALHRRLRPYRRLQLRVRDRVRISFSEHAGIVEAVVAGDGDLAAERARNHVVVQGERFTDLVASLASLQGEAARAHAD